MPQTLLPDLFRMEYGKIVAVLVRGFDVNRVSAAEDIASDAFALAVETWGKKGIPDNPTGWLYTVAKNKARDLARREGMYAKKIEPELARTGDWSLAIDFDFSPAGFEDSQLKMMFALCHPALPADTQVALCLRILCGFGIDEIAAAFLTNKATINKRLTRGKRRLRSFMQTIELPPQHQFSERLGAVLTTLYLLFNEGYHSTVTSHTFRRELCADSIRLAVLLTRNDRTDTPDVNALLALMCFQTSRFDARADEAGDIIVYSQQNRELWDDRLIQQGKQFLHLAMASGHQGKYQLEAAISLLHTEPDERPEKWEQILILYNRLLMIEYSPVVALNRTYAYSRVNGPAAALKEALKIDLAGSFAYHLLLGELYHELNDRLQANTHFAAAQRLTKNPAIVRYLRGREI